MPSTSKLFTPIRLGALHLQHRVILAPMTRNRATASRKHARTWHCNELMTLHYRQRATTGGLLISEATAVSLEGSGMAGVPGLFTPEQKLKWKDVTSAVHQDGGSFFIQSAFLDLNQLVWHAGRTTHSNITGMQPASPSAIPISDTKHSWPTLPTVDYEVPREMNRIDIKNTIADFVRAAIAAREVGADGVELHGANGYFLDQFLHSNINHREDEYGGSVEKRCRFVLDVTAAVGSAIGFDRLAVRLSPFTLFQQTRGRHRIPQWSYLCRRLSELSLAYVHLVEPRFDEFRPEQVKLRELLSSPDNLVPAQLSLKPFREALGSTPLVVSGGYNATNCWEGIEHGDHDAISFGRYFTSNADLVLKLREGIPLVQYDRSRFYGPFPGSNEVGYTTGHLA